MFTLTDRHWLRLSTQDFNFCHFVHSGRVSASVHAGIHTSPSRHPPGQTPPPPSADTPWVDTPPGRHPPPRQTPPGRHPLPPAVTAADGTHPTGMHSCVEVFILHWDRDWRWPPLGAVYDFYRMLLFLSISEQVIFFFRLFYSSRKKIAPKRWLLLQHTCSFIRRQIWFV